MAVRIKAADSAYTVDSDLLNFILGILDCDRIPCLRSDRLSRDDSDLIASLGNRISLSDTVHIASGLTASLTSGLGRSTRQLLPNNITDLDGGRRIHHLFDVR